MTIVLANQVGLMFRHKTDKEAPAMQDVIVRCGVYDDGWLVTSKPQDAEILVEELEVAHWIDIGGEDREIYLNDDVWDALKLREAFKHLRTEWIEIQ